MESKQFLVDQEVSVTDLGGGVSRQILGYNDQIMMVKVFFDKGSVGALHTHPHTQTTYCATGAFEFTIGDKKRVIKEGDATYIAPGILHGALCLEAGVLIDTFSPVREDFL